MKKVLKISVIEIDIFSLLENEESKLILQSNLDDFNDQFVQKNQAATILYLVFEFQVAYSSTCNNELNQIIKRHVFDFTHHLSIIYYLATFCTLFSRVKNQGKNN